MTTITSEELRRRFRDLTLKNLSEDERDSIMLRISDDEIRLFNAWGEAGDVEKCRVLITKVAARPVREIATEEIKREIRHLLSRVLKLTDAQISHIMRRVTRADLIKFFELSQANDSDGTQALLDAIWERHVLH